MQDEILGDIATVLSSVSGVDPADVTPEKSFTGDLGVDSVTMLEAVVELEDRFGLLIADDDWSQFSTVGDLVSYLERAGVGTPA